MITESEIQYLKKTIKNHIEFNMTENSQTAFKKSEILWLQYDNINEHQNFKRPVIIIPILNDSILVDENPWEVEFRKTKLVLWGRIPPPSDEWVLEDKKDPLWYKKNKNIYLCSWNLVSILFNLITLEEEINLQTKDNHDRFPEISLKRYKKKLLDVPIFNNSIAALVDKCLQLQEPETYKDQLIAKPLKICISHDIDAVDGNDFWSQSARIFRFLNPIIKAKIPKFNQLWFILINYLRPKKFYSDSVEGMITIERLFGYRSICYLLNGKRGRFEARSKFSSVSNFAKKIPTGWLLGMHYNYNTHLKEEPFIFQKIALENIKEGISNFGRAHYLRLDPKLSLIFWDKMGIKVDESIGYSNEIGYRAGIGGVFKSFNKDLQNEIDIICLPLIVMDQNLNFDNEDHLLKYIEDLVSHLSIVGGIFTLLFHPEQFDNPEFPKLRKTYIKILGIFYRYDAKSILPNEIKF